MVDGGNICIGKHCFFNRGCSLTSRILIEIGDDSIFGENVSIYDHNHRTEIGDGPFRTQGFDDEPVRIGNNVWIGSGSIILAGVSIGDNCVIAAGSVISKSVPSNSILIQKRHSTVVSRRKR